MYIKDADERNAMLAAIIESSEDAIISKNLDGIITSWNKSAERMFGYTEAEVIGKHISILIPHDRLAEEEMIISSLKQGKRIEHFQTIRVAKSGKQLHISLSVSPVRNSLGIIAGASKIARDITKQKEAEDMVNQYVRRLEIINETGKAIAADLSMEKILQKATDATTQLSGAAFGAFFYNKTNSKGEAYMLYALSGAPKEAFEKFGMPRNTDVFDMTFSGKGILRSDDITKDPRYGKNAPNKGMPPGHLPVVSYLAVPVVSQTSIVIGGLFFGHPQPGMFKEEHEVLVEAIANQAAVALDNAKLYEEIQALNSKKDEFIGFASHELKTPLTTITGYLQLADDNPGMMVQFLPKLNKQVSRLSTIISDLLDISKIQAGKFELSFTKVSLLALIKESVESVKQLTNFHEIRYELPAENLILKIDNTKMSQVLVNVFANSIKYAPDSKKIILRAERLGNELQISIQDWGIGIAEEHLDKIFTQFYRAAKGDEKGLGLGLYFCKEIVEAHHGKIWAESKLGEGTTIFISLPIEKITE